MYFVSNKASNRSWNSENGATYKKHLSSGFWAICLTIYGVILIERRCLPIFRR